MVSGEIAGLLQESTERDLEQEVTEITEELRRNRPHRGIQGTKGTEPFLAIEPLVGFRGLTAVARETFIKKCLTVSLFPPLSP